MRVEVVLLQEERLDGSLAREMQETESAILAITQPIENLTNQRNDLLRELDACTLESGRLGTEMVSLSDSVKECRSDCADLENEIAKIRKAMIEPAKKRAAVQPKKNRAQKQENRDTKVKMPVKREATVEEPESKPVDPNLVNKWKEENGSVLGNVLSVATNVGNKLKSLFY